jgi:PAS domain S-box-containing protein
MRPTLSRGYPVKSAVTLTILVAVLGVLASAGAGAMMALGQKRVALQQLDRRASLVAEAATAETYRYVDTLRAVAAAVGAVERLTAETFGQITAPAAQGGLAGATSVGFFVPASDEQIPTLQAYWRANGEPDLTLHPVGEGKEHIFSVLSQPLDGGNTLAHGVDVTQSSVPTQALIESRRTGQVTVSGPYHLIRDQALPAGRRQLSFVLTAPVFTGPADARTFRGWVLMGLRGQDFVGVRLRRVAQDLVDVYLRAHAVDGALVSVAELRAPVSGRRDVSRTVDVVVAQQVWQLQVQANGFRLPGAASGLPTAWTISGCALSLMLAGLVFVLATGRARAQARVEDATADLRDAEAQARTQAELLTAILESISDGVGVIDQDGQSLLSNPAARRLLGGGYVLGDQDAQPPQYGVYRVDGLSPVRAPDMPLARALAGESVDGMEMVIWDDEQPNGVFLSVSARPLFANGAQRGAVAVLHDITGPKQHEQQLTATAKRLADELTLRETTETDLRTARDELAAREAYLADVIDSVDVAIAICDTHGRITRSNRIAKEIAGAGPVGTTVEEVTTRVNADFGDSLSPAIEHDNPLLAALSGLEVQDKEVTIAPPGRPQRTLLVHARPLRGADGQITGAVSSAADITTVREQQAELAAFAGVVAHDLKSPLTAIAGYTDIIDEELEAGRYDPAVLRPLLNRVIGGVTRMRKLIDDLLTYATARDGAIQPTTCDLRVVADEVVGAQLDDALPGTSSPPDVYVGHLPLVHGDPAMLRQLLHNLISNAIKYTPPGRTPRVDITARADQPGWVRVEVADRGIGIPAGQHQAIFAGFHRAHPEAGLPGTGLGLAICQRIVQRHGGTITATDNVGGGTRIKLTLPAASDQSASPERQAVMSSAPQS